MKISTSYGSLFLIGATLMSAVACSGSDAATTSLTIVAYESFTPPAGAFDAFTAKTGIVVNVALSGDAGEMVAKAALTSGNPEGDVLWGVDNTLLSRTIEAEVFDPYVSTKASLLSSLVAIAQETVTPVDFGDVCVNYDIADLQQRGLTAPVTLEDLISPEYKSLLVVENAATSSTGLAFLLATIAAFGNNWPDYWQKLLINDVLVVDSWNDAYYSSFSRYGGNRPLVVSYSTSPPAEVIFADPPLPADSAALTGVATETCFRQVEFAGVLRGTQKVTQARLLVDYLVSPEFQTLLPESLFVYPANANAQLPDSFIKYAPAITNTFTLPIDEIASNRQQWVDTWTNLVLG